MVKLSVGNESPVDEAFNDIFEVIQEIEMFNSAQIVPSITDDTIHEVKVKIEPPEAKPSCLQSCQFSDWVNMSIHAEKDHFPYQQLTTLSKYKQELELGDEQLLNDTKTLFELPSEDSELAKTKYAAVNEQIDIEPPGWFEQPFNEDFFSLAKHYEETKGLGEELSVGGCTSEVTEEEKVKEHKKFPPKGQGRNKTLKRCPKSFKSSGRPRLCQFLLELLNDPANYSNLIEWLDKDKGVFKFLNSSRVAQEWGTRRNKPKMKYENFARSLRTYIAKGILTKPRSKLVYRFSSL